MKKSIIALTLVLVSGSAMAATADVEGTLNSFKAAEKLLCKDVTPAMAAANMKAGINILIIASAADDAEKKGDLETVAKAKAAIESIQKASDELSTAFNAKCVNGDAVFAEVPATADGSSK